MASRGDKKMNDFSFFDIQEDDFGWMVRREEGGRKERERRVHQMIYYNVH